MFDQGLPEKPHKNCKNFSSIPPWISQVKYDSDWGITQYLPRFHIFNYQNIIEHGNIGTTALSTS